MREASPMAGERNLGVTFSRTMIPTLPTGYLSRRDRFPLIDNDSNGTTFVIAPHGYGKTTLISEWAQNQKKGVIWLTVTSSDTNNEMSAMLIAATRNVVPGFAPWFETDQPMRSTDVVRRWGNELLATGKKFIFVLDNLRSDDKEDVDIAIKLVEQFPSNIHFVAIRTSEIPGLYPTCSSRGLLKIITVKDLRFAPEESMRLALNYGLKLDAEMQTTLEMAAGWPAAVSLLITHILGNGSKSDVEKIMLSSVEPLRALVMLVLNASDNELIEICERLSILESFNLDEASMLLGDKYNYDLINEIAYKGEIFSPIRKPGEGYKFSPMVRQVLLEKLRAKEEIKRELHRKAMAFYENHGDAGAAIDHAFELGDSKKISQLFPDASRIKQAKGQGGELIRWSPMAAMSPVDGEANRSTLLITGYLADLDFNLAQSEIGKLKLLSESATNKEFFEQFIAGAECYSLISLGRFDDFENSYQRTRTGTDECLLGVDDQINVLRMLATKHYVWNEIEGVEKAYELSLELGKATSLITSHTFLLAIQAMHLHQRGDYKRAYEVSLMATERHFKNRFVGNHGPLDVMYVQARCLLEFSRQAEALSLLETVQKNSYQWKQWHWYFASDQHFVEALTYQGNTHQALERIKVGRDLARGIDAVHELQVFSDLAEMNVRRFMKDFDRLENLIDRAPNIRHVRQMKLALDQHRGKKNFESDVKKFPSSAPRDIIWKHLLEASVNIERENVALAEMRKAMEVGSKVGAKESFLRQRDELGNLVIRVANDFPTIYNEELASAMAERMRERGSKVEANNPGLTKREQEILRQLSTGRTLTVIAGELHISQNTMKTHLKNLYKKIGAEGRHDAVEKAKAQFLL